MSLVHDTHLDLHERVRALPPRRYEVVLSQHPDIRPRGVRFFPATTRTLRAVFHMNHEESHIRAAEAARTGRSPMLQSTWDHAQTKAMEANAYLQNLAPISPGVWDDNIQFVIEPMD